MAAIGRQFLLGNVFKIEKCIQGGAGLSRQPDGLVCFIENALPGELVKTRLVEKKKDFVKATVIEVLEPHEKRRTPPCPYYGKCGGCGAQHAEFSLQTEILREMVFDLFLRIAKINLPQSFEVHSASEWGYRNRAQVFKTGDDCIPCGFLARASNTVIPIDKCPVLSQNLNEKLKENPSQKKRYLFDNQSEKFLGKHIYADESVFFQSNLELLPKLIDFVRNAAGEGSVLMDVFCGVGLFSAFLQDKFERVIAIEQNPLCQKFAEKNLGRNCEFYATDAEEWNDFGGCILLDPPRTGLTSKLCEKIKGDKIIYVSCNPATLARDTRKLLNAGYKLKNIQGYAFYPQTFHLEMVAELLAV